MLFECLVSFCLIYSSVVVMRRSLRMCSVVLRVVCLRMKVSGVLRSESMKDVLSGMVCFVL